MNEIISGDSIKVMKEMEENSVDTIVTDPPYGLEFMGKEWDSFRSKNEIKEVSGMMKEKNFKKLPSYGPKDNIKCPECNKWEWDYPERKCVCGGAGRHHRQQFGNAFTQFTYDWAKEALRVIKPGGMLLCFGGTRTFHRAAVGIEDAGWEIRDTLMWLYGSGFPKSLNIGKAIDKTKGTEKIVGKGRAGKTALGQSSEWNKTNNPHEFNITEPNSDEAKLWDGWGTALKPAYEPIVLAMKPVDKTFANNALKHKVAGLNIDGGEDRDRGADI